MRMFFNNGVERCPGGESKAMTGGRKVEGDRGENVHCREEAGVVG